MTVLTNQEARSDVLNRLRRAEGQIRGVQRMLEEGEDCLKIAQQFAAVRKELSGCMREDDQAKAGLGTMLKDLETLLARMG